MAGQDKKIIDQDFITILQKYKKTDSNEILFL